jgi:arginine repressor
LFDPARVGTNFLVSIQSELGKSYTLQYLDALGSSWQNLPTITGDGNVITVTNSAAKAQRFYRLLEQ